ncbi:MAG: hypothetical protein MZV63_37400 [Marinilabiliales bacterium]|nr:hypothetical protein [Marinilabiliales bacterium]
MFFWAVAGPFLGGRGAPAGEPSPASPPAGIQRLRHRDPAGHADRPDHGAAVRRPALAVRGQHLRGQPGGHRHGPGDGPAHDRHHRGRPLGLGHRGRDRHHGGDRGGGRAAGHGLLAGALPGGAQAVRGHLHPAAADGLLGGVRHPGRHAGGRGGPGRPAARLPGPGGRLAHLRGHHHRPVQEPGVRLDHPHGGGLLRPGRPRRGQRGGRAHHQVGGDRHLHGDHRGLHLQPDLLPCEAE